MAWPEAELVEPFRPTLMDIEVCVACEVIRKRGSAIKKGKIREER